MKINNSDVKAAFLLAAENEFSDVPEESDLSHSFSPRFVEWGEWMVTYRFPVKHIQSAKRIVRAILIAALIAALLVGTAMAFPAVREAVKKFFVRKDGNMQYIEFYINGTDTTEACPTKPTKDGSIPGVKDEIILDVEVQAPTNSSDARPGPPIPIEYRFPTYLPAGLVVESEVLNPFAISTVMSGPNGLSCDYSQSALPNGSTTDTSIGFGSAYVHSEKMICGMQMHFFSGATTNVLIWTDDFYLYNLVVNADMPIEEIEKIISSIAPRDDLNNPQS